MKEIHVILTETLTCFLHGRAKELSAPCITSDKELVLLKAYLYVVCLF